MRFARIRDKDEHDIHLWVDDGFEVGDADLLVKMMHMLSRKFGYSFEDTQYEKKHDS